MSDDQYPDIPKGRLVIPPIEASTDLGAAPEDVEKSRQLVAEMAERFHARHCKYCWDTEPNSGGQACLLGDALARLQEVRGNE